MPRPGSTGDRSDAGPKPFSKEWLEAPEAQRAPSKRRRRLALPNWLPSDGVLSAILVAVVIIGATIAGGAPSIARSTSDYSGKSILAPGAGGSSGAAPADPSAEAAVPPAVNAVLVPPVAQSNDSDPTQVPPPTVSSEQPTAVPDIAITAATGGEPTGGDQAAVLPSYRILSYYGHPAATTMGILGEFGMPDLLRELTKEKEAWEAADPSRPIMPAFEIIGSVAQREPQDDGTYLLHTSPKTIRKYIDFTRENGMLLIIDLQIGRSSVEDEIAWVTQFLGEPHVHVALDPEFAVAEGEVPGENYGGIGAADVKYAQQALADYATQSNLPPKVLIVHRFTFKMIDGIETVKPVPGVQTVIDFDGWGVPDAKIEGFEVFVRDSPVEFTGIKLFYKQDSPLMQPEDVITLEPAPDVVIYQ